MSLTEIKSKFFFFNSLYQNKGVTYKLMKYILTINYGIYNVKHETRISK